MAEVDPSQMFAEAIRKMKASGLKLLTVTGNNRTPAAAAANKLGMTTGQTFYRAKKRRWSKLSSPKVARGNGRRQSEQRPGLSASAGGHTYGHWPTLLRWKQLM